MLRLDKYLCDSQIGTRSQVKGYLKQGLVSVNGVTVTRPEAKIDEAGDCITFRGRPCGYRKYAYFMLNKPAGTVSARRDNTCRTVTELLRGTGYTDLFPVGRLDKDTEGLLLMTNDGALAHALLSPGKHVKKVYYAELKKPLSEEAARRLAEGLDIGDDRPTLPAGVERVTQESILLTITEGRFHQVKRMLQAVGNEVVYLKRMAMGSLYLDETLKKGEYRELTAGEIEALTTPLPHQNQSIY